MYYVFKKTYPDIIIILTMCFSQNLWLGQLVHVSLIHFDWDIWYICKKFCTLMRPLHYLLHLNTICWFISIYLLTIFLFKQISLISYSYIMMVPFLEYLSFMRIATKVAKRKKTIGKTLPRSTGKVARKAVYSGISNFLLSWTTSK